MLKLDLSTIGLLDETAFTIDAPRLNGSVYSLRFWFYNPPSSGIRIIANVGNKTLAQKGWTVYLDDNSSTLVFRCNSNARNSQEMVTTLPGANRWHHFAAVVGKATEQITAYLNGSAQTWRQREARELVDPASVGADAGQLIIGGYTDAAGGHFNYRFHGLVDDFQIDSNMFSADQLNDIVKQQSRTVKAEFNTEPESESAPCPVNFAAVKQDNIIAYLWDFADGCRALGSTLRHDYAYAGRYNVTLTVISEGHKQTTVERELILRGTENPLKTRPVFVNNSDGYACFRIPAIVRATNGDLIAFAEGRVADCSDATQAIHIVCKHSHDQGQTWQALQVVARNIVNGEDYACMNPAPVVDELCGSGKIIVLFNKMESSEWAITQGQGVSRVCSIVSEDHGKTWNEAEDITVQVHKPGPPADWRKQVPTLGHAIQLHGTPENPATRGRLFYIGCRTEGAESVFYTQNYAFWSDDAGQSWQIGGIVSIRADGSSAKGLGEAAAAELADGSVLINSRNYQYGKVVGARAVTIGRFDSQGNISFEPTRHDTTLTDSGVQASLIRHKDILVFANPAHPDARLRMTVRFSDDEGKTWPGSRVIDPGPAAYSDLVIPRDRQIGVLYEQGNHGGIVYLDFPLHDL